MFLVTSINQLTMWSTTEASAPITLTVPDGLYLSGAFTVITPATSPG